MEGTTKHRNTFGSKSLIFATLSSWLPRKNKSFCWWPTLMEILHFKLHHLQETDVFLFDNSQHGNLPQEGMKIKILEKPPSWGFFVEKTSHFSLLTSPLINHLVSLKGGFLKSREGPDINVLSQCGSNRLEVEMMMSSKLGCQWFTSWNEKVFH